MLDTSLVKAIENTAIEFNEWAWKKPLWQKMNINDIKGVFSEKLKRNVKSTTYVPNSSIFTPLIIKNISIQNSRIISLEFMPGESSFPYGMTSADRRFVDHCRNAVAMIDFGNLSTDVPVDLSMELNSVITSINNFKIN